jgi:hypothetical protein
MDMDGLIRTGVIYKQKEAFEWLKDALISKLR